METHLILIPSFVINLHWTACSLFKQIHVCKQFSEKLSTLPAIKVSRQSAFLSQVLTLSTGAGEMQYQTTVET